MVEYVNGGVYEVEFHGQTPSEFDGNHPAIIIRTRKEDDIYFLIPLTTFTEDRWKEDKKHFACRLISTNSIAVISKFQVSHKREIKAKNITKQTNRVMVITPDELNSVTEKVLTYAKVSIDEAKKEYEKYFKQYQEFERICKSCFVDNENNQEFFTKQNDITIVFSCENLRTLHKRDIKNVIGHYLNLSHSVGFYRGDTICKIYLK